jgi:hypothetical protein
VFVCDPEADEQGDGEACGQAEYVDGGVDLVFEEVAPGDFEVVG